MKPDKLNAGRGRCSRRVAVQRPVRQQPAGRRRHAFPQPNGGDRITDSRKRVK